MIVRIYDFLSAEKPKFSENLVGIVSDVTKFKYTRRAYDIGSFEMEVPTHANDAEYIQPDRMLIVGEKLSETYISGDPTRRIVNGTFLYVTEVDKNDQTITVTGYDLKYLFASRVTLFPAEEQDKGTYGYYVVSGTTFSCISNLINYNIINATDSDRQIFGMSAITMPTTQVDAGLTGIQDDRYMTRLEPLSTAIFNLLKNCKTHFYDVRLLIDDNAEDADNYNPHLESSEDKPTIIIDESRYNIKSYTRKDGTSAYKNAIYAVSGTGDDVLVKCVKREGDTASGIKRKEVVLDVDTDSVSEIDRYAIKAAEDYNISDDFEIEPLFDDDDAEPTLAQKVLIRIDGVDYETVITEITDEYSDGKHTQSYVCGDKKLKVLNVLNKATAGNTQKIIDNKINIGNKGGVGKFTDADKNCEIFNDYENNIAKSDYAHAEGYKTSATAKYSHSEGSETIASGISSHAEGAKCTASSDCSHAEGYSTNALSSYTHAEGFKTSVTAPYAHAEGYATVANAPAAHAEGSETKAEQYAHAEGCGTKATGYASHAEGHFATSSGDHSHAEGNSTVAQGINSHAEGNTCRAANNNTHAGGIYSDALGNHSFVHGYGVKISYPCGTGFGRRNKTQNALFVIGNGDWNEGTESDALTLDEHGNLYISGKFTADGGIDIPIATADSVGCVKIGDNISVADDGTISVDLSTYLQSADIADWAKQPAKPTYTASEVGAAAEQHTHSTADITDFPTIPTKVSELQNDSGYISEETDPTVPAWAKADTKPTYTASEVGAAEAVHTHAQSDITGLASALDGKANTSHTHTKSDITDFPTSMKNPNALTVQFNGTTNQTYDGSAAKTVNITPAGIGAATAEDVNTAIDAVNIGGRNIVTGTAAMSIGVINSATWENGQWRKSGTGDAETIDIADPPIPSISKGVRFTQTTGKNQIGIVQDKVLINSNTVYTLSCWARSNSADGVTCKLQPFFKTATDNGGYSEIIVKDSWQKISFTAIRPPQATNKYSCAYIYLQPTEIGSYIDVCAIKFEAGNKVTDWSPAPEDAERRIASLEARVAALEAAALAGGE